MQTPDPIRCTYCDTIQMWSAEQTDRTMMGEVHSCPNCGQMTHTWDDRSGHQLETDRTMSWVETEPIY
jgi:hypothetical protein